MHTNRIWIPVTIGATSVLTFLFINCGRFDACLIDGQLWHALAFGLFKPAFAYSIFMLPAALLALFSIEKAYRSWRWFTGWFLFVSILVPFAFPASAGGFFSIFSEPRFVVAGFLGFIYLLISLVLLTVQTIKARKEKKS